MIRACLFLVLVVAQAAVSQVEPDCDEWRLDSEENDDTDRMVYQQARKNVRLLQKGLVAIDVREPGVDYCLSDVAEYRPSSQRLKLGKKKLRWAFNINREYADARLAPIIAIAAVVAHEFGHVLQDKKIKDERYAEDSREVRKAMELEADAFAGAFLRALYGWDEKKVVEGLTIFHFMGDTEFVGDHHGTPGERVGYALLGHSLAEFRSAVSVGRIHEAAFQPGAEDVILTSVTAAEAILDFLEGVDRLSASLAQDKGRDAISREFDFLVSAEEGGYSPLLLLDRRSKDRERFRRVAGDLLVLRRKWNEEVDRGEFHGLEIARAVGELDAQVKEAYREQLLDIALARNKELIGERLHAVHALKRFGDGEALASVLVWVREQEGEVAPDDAAVARVTLSELQPWILREDLSTQARAALRHGLELSLRPAIEPDDSYRAKTVGLVYLLGRNEEDRIWARATLAEATKDPSTLVKRRAESDLKKFAGGDQ